MSQSREVARGGGMDGKMPIGSPGVATTRPSFASFYREHFAGVVALGLSLTGDRAPAEDVAQEAFTRAYREWDGIGAYDDPGAWVRRVATNLAISRWRRWRSEAQALLRLRGRPTPPLTLPRLDEHFWAEVRALPRRQAVAVALHYVEDLPVAQVATVMEVTEGTVKAHLHRARQALADRLEEAPR